MKKESVIAGRTLQLMNGTAHPGEGPRRAFVDLCRESLKEFKFADRPDTAELARNPEAGHLLCYVLHAMQGYLAEEKPGRTTSISRVALAKAFGIERKTRGSPGTPIATAMGICNVYLDTLTKENDAAGKRLPSADQTALVAAFKDQTGRGFVKGDEGDRKAMKALKALLKVHGYRLPAGRPR